MGAREHRVEKHLDEEVKRIGGITRKWVSPGRHGVPDRIVVYKHHVAFVEVKTTDGKLSLGQQREHHRLKSAGATVFTLYGEAQVDTFIEYLLSLSTPDTRVTVV